MEISLNRENALSKKQLSLSDILPWLYGVLTCVLTLIFSYNNIQPWSTLFAVLFGAFITYIVQNILQRDSEKRRINVDYVEKYYGPLLVEIQKIQKEVLNEISGYYNLQDLKIFKTYPQFYTMGQNLRTDFLNFSDEIEKLTRKINFINIKLINLICEKGNPLLQRPLGTIVNFSSDSSIFPIYLRYTYESVWATIPLSKSFLLDKNPIELIKENVTNFQEKNLQAEFHIEIRNDDGSSPRSDIKLTSYSESSEILNKIISEVKKELDRDKSYSDFKIELNSLIKKGESISSRLIKYIEKYISIVNI